MLGEEFKPHLLGGRRNRRPGKVRVRDRPSSVQAHLGPPGDHIHRIIAIRSPPQRASPSTSSSPREAHH